ncbi:MAG: CCA tRNA nucleotidyltransferase [Planctomycetota bacterium]
MSYEAAVEIVRRLAEAGHTAYLAGGCVRDRVLGLEPKDYDVATAAEPGVVLGMFRHARAVGEAFGVVLVPLRKAHIEVATFREEWGYSDGRRPDGVRFTDAARDAQRRDFTINGLFADPLDRPTAASDNATTRELPGFGRVIDYVGGLADLDAKVLRAVGDPSERFGEDHLRMLRAVRFAARLNLAIDPTTQRAIRASARYLGEVSRERIGGEIGMMLARPTRAEAASLLTSLKLDGPALNEDRPAQPADAPSRLAALPDDAPATLALAAWMLDRHAPEAGLAEAAAWDFRPALRRLRSALALSNADEQAVAASLAGLAALASWPDLPVHARKRALARPHADAALALAGTMTDTVAIAADAGDLRRQGVAPDPLVTGDDLIAMGHKPGPAFKRLLDAVYDAQLDGEVAERDAALAHLRRLVGGAG